MKEKRFTKRQMLCAVLLTAALTLGGVLLSLCLLLGPHGLSVMEGFVLIRTLFVEQADLKQVADDALYAMDAATGDRWTYYLDAQRNDTVRLSRANMASGIGVRVLLMEDGLLITDVTPEGGADQAGLRVGETLTHAQGKPLYGEDQEKRLEWIRGEAGTYASLTVRDESGQVRQVEVCRGDWFDPPVRYDMLEGNVGYVRLFNFHTGSADAFRAAVDDLAAQGAQSLLFDVRQNPGGYLDELEEILDYLLPEGTVFRQRTSWGMTLKGKSDAACVDLPKAVLLDADSYSAAELFAAQLREAEGAYLVGEHTSGKGYFQYTFPMPNGGALGLSIGKYTTGGDVSLAGVGIEPDAAVSLTEEQSAWLSARWLKPEQDPQLQTALGWLRGGAVMGAPV